MPVPGEQAGRNENNSHHGLQHIERLRGSENYASWKFAMKA